MDGRFAIIIRVFIKYRHTFNGCARTRARRDFIQNTGIGLSPTKCTIYSIDDIYIYHIYIYYIIYINVQFTALMIYIYIIYIYYIIYILIYIYIIYILYYIYIIYII